MNATQQQMTAAALAAEFSRRLVEELTAEQLVTVIARNALEEDDGICHSHDFCDANEVMAAALAEIKGCSFDEAFDCVDIPLVNAAWQMAKENCFEVVAN